MRRISREDETLYLELAGEFYSSNAVDHDIPQSYLRAAFDEMMRSNEYLEGYILECENEDVGYALIVKTFSQEAGGMTLWLDELYVRNEFRGKAIGSDFIKYLENDKDKTVKRLRLEVESSNSRAAALYGRLGFYPLEYCQMIKDF